MSATQEFYRALADGVLILHVSFVIFVVVGLVLVWIGGVRKWSFVRNRWFRLAHVAAIGVVAAEALVGLACPLTLWENRLRVLAGGGERYSESFIQHWLQQALFHDWSEATFTLVYVGFFLLVALSFRLVPVKTWTRGRGDTRSVPTPP